LVQGEEESYFNLGKVMLAKIHLTATVALASLGYATSDRIVSMCCCVSQGSQDKYSRRHGATTFSMAILSIMTFIVTIKNATFGIMTLNALAECRSAECLLFWVSQLSPLC